MEALVEYNYEAQEPDELSIRKGDVIKDVKVLNGGWWEGTLRDKRGMFPDNFVKMLEPPGAAKKEPKQEEVTLRNGSEGWWKGEINGRIGVFPDNFVEMITVHVIKGWKSGKQTSNLISSLKRLVDDK